MRSPDLIKTPRLTLIPLTALQLSEYLNGTGPEFSQISSGILTERLRRAIQIKLEKMAVSSDQWQPWITYWLVQIKSDGFGAGLIGFKGDPDREGQVEIGYGIDPAYQNQGYITEAVLAMAGWAFRDSRCQQIIAPDTPRSNPASNRVLQKSGFSIYHETKDLTSWVLKREHFPENG